MERWAGPPTPVFATSSSAFAAVYESSANHHHPADSTWMAFALAWVRETLTAQDAADQAKAEQAVEPRQTGLPDAACQRPADQTQHDIGKDEAG